MLFCTVAAAAAISRMVLVGAQKATGGQVLPSRQLCSSVQQHRLGEACTCQRALVHVSGYAQQAAAADIDPAASAKWGGRVNLCGAAARVGGRAGGLSTTNAFWIQCTVLQAGEGLVCGRGRWIPAGRLISPTETESCLEIILARCAAAAMKPPRSQQHRRVGFADL